MRVDVNGSIDKDRVELKGEIQSGIINDNRKLAEGAVRVRDRRTGYTKHRTTCPKLSETGAPCRPVPS